MSRWQVFLRALKWQGRAPQCAGRLPVQFDWSFYRWIWSRILNRVHIERLVAGAPGNKAILRLRAVKISELSPKLLCMLRAPRGKVRRERSPEPRQRRPQAAHGCRHAWRERAGKCGRSVQPATQLGALCLVTQMDADTPVHKEMRPPPDVSPSVFSGHFISR